MEKMHITIPSDNPNEPIGASEFIHFLMLFHKTYSGYATALSENRLELAMGERMEQTAERFIRNYEPSNIDSSVFDPSFEEAHEFKITSINRNSPVELVIYGIPVALTAAVILSGGKVKISGAKFELPPIGKGLKSLKKALGSDKTNQQRIEHDES